MLDEYNLRVKTYMEDKAAYDSNLTRSQYVLWGEREILDPNLKTSLDDSFIRAKSKLDELELLNKVSSGNILPDKRIDNQLVNSLEENLVVDNVKDLIKKNGYTFRPGTNMIETDYTLNFPMSEMYAKPQQQELTAEDKPLQKLTLNSSRAEQIRQDEKGTFKLDCLSNPEVRNEVIQRIKDSRCKETQLVVYVNKQDPDYQPEHIICTLPQAPGGQLTITHVPPLPGSSRDHAIYIEDSSGPSVTNTRPPVPQYP